MALMMEVEQAWLARTFVEYELLPRLLALPGVGWSNGPPRSWFKFLSERECNLEHMLDEDMPAHDDIPNYLVKDAWHLVRQLQLVSEQGLTRPAKTLQICKSSHGKFAMLNHIMVLVCPTCRCPGNLQSDIKRG